MSKQAGFTLIEMVMVIAIIGVLAAVAIPKFVDLRSEAALASVQGIAGGLSSASSVNYAARKLKPAKGVAITNCTDAAGALQDGLPEGFSIAAAAVAVDATVTCTLTGPDNQKAQFSAIGIL